MITDQSLMLPALSRYLWGRPQQLLMLHRSDPPPPPHLDITTHIYWLSMLLTVLWCIDLYSLSSALSITSMVSVVVAASPSAILLAVLLVVLLTVLLAALLAALLALAALVLLPLYLETRGLPAVLLLLWVWTWAQVTEITPLRLWAIMKWCMKTAEEEWNSQSCSYHWTLKRQRTNNSKAWGHETQHISLI